MVGYKTIIENLKTTYQTPLIAAGALTNMGMIVFIYGYAIPTPWSQEFTMGFAYGAFTFILLGKKSIVEMIVMIKDWLGGEKHIKDVLVDKKVKS